MGRIYLWAKTETWTNNKNIYLFGWRCESYRATPILVLTFTQMKFNFVFIFFLHHCPLFAWNTLFVVIIRNVKKGKTIQMKCTYSFIYVFAHYIFGYESEIFSVLNLIFNFYFFLFSLFLVHRVCFTHSPAL